MNHRRIFEFLFLLLCSNQIVAQVNKAPAYPLITHDPYFSIWSMTDTLNASPTKHWTGADQPLIGLIKADGRTYRVIGSSSKEHENITDDQPAEINAEQKNVTINATQTIYDFSCGPLDATITFTSPLLLKDLDILSRPVSYITYSVRSNDGKTHDVQVYFGASTNIAVNTPEQEVVTDAYTGLQLNILKAGTKEQPVLQKKGDDLRIDWGYMYVAACYR